MNNINFEKYFKNKKITLMGIGGMGRGVIEAEFLIKYGADVIFTDLSSEEDLKKEINKIKKASKKYVKNGAKISFTLGKQKISDFKNRDIVLYPNGVRLNNEYILAAKKYSKIITKSIALVFWILRQEKSNIKSIGVTGTKGKSTTVGLIQHLIETNNKKIYSGGNIRGSSNLPILEKIREGDFILAELDSWLLQGFRDLKISPHISIFTNFFNDHQNYYKSMKKYFLDKSYIFKFQKKDDFLILTNQSSRIIKEYSKMKIKSKKVVAKTFSLPKWKYSIFGKHNEENISQVIELGRILEISEKDIKKTMETFKSVEGRFQYLGKKKGVYFYNDNNSTTPDSSIISLKSIAEKYPESNIYLLAGGSDKEFNFKKFSFAIQKYSTQVVLFEGNGTDKIISFFSKTFRNYEIVYSMKNAFLKMVKFAKKNDVVILSPGSASFGVFKNEYDRNDKFLNEFNKFNIKK